MSSLFRRFIFREISLHYKPYDTHILYPETIDEQVAETTVNAIV
jgi:hypothetical protein